MTGREPLDLDAIEARAAAATDGPWEIYRYRTGGGRIHVSGDDGRKRELIADTEAEPNVATIYNEGDREFLLHAREDVPALVAEVKRLRERTGWTSASGHCRVTCVCRQPEIAERDAALAAVERLRERASDVDLIRRAIADPGQFLPRGDNYAETIPSWSARAVVRALDAETAGQQR